MIRTRPGEVLVWGIVALAIVAVLARIVYIDVKNNTFTETTLQPQVVSQDQSMDPRVVGIGVTWTNEGWCDGEFRVTAKETSTEIKVNPVVDRTYAGGGCPGLGTVNNMAWATLQLAAPLGTRPVVRASDGATLLYYTSIDGLVRKGPNSADISHYGGLNDNPQFRLRKSSRSPTHSSSTSSCASSMPCHRFRRGRGTATLTTVRIT